MYKYCMSEELYWNLIDALSIRKGKEIVRYAGKQDVIDYLNISGGINRKITDLVTEKQRSVANAQVVKELALGAQEKKGA